MIYWAKNDKGWTRQNAKRSTETINRFNEAFYYLKVNLAFKKTRKSDNEKTEMSFRSSPGSEFDGLNYFQQWRKKREFELTRRFQVHTEKSLRIHLNTKIHILKFLSMRNVNKTMETRSSGTNRTSTFHLSCSHGTRNGEKRQNGFHWHGLRWCDETRAEGHSTSIYAWLTRTVASLSCHTWWNRWCQFWGPLKTKVSK